VTIQLLLEAQLPLPVQLSLPVQLALAAKPKPARLRSMSWAGGRNPGTGSPGARGSRHPPMLKAAAGRGP